MVSRWLKLYIHHVNVIKFLYRIICFSSSGKELIEMNNWDICSADIWYERLSELQWTLLLKEEIVTQSFNNFCRLSSPRVQISS